MTNLEELETAVSNLPSDELAKFREWFERFNATRFDHLIELDTQSGKLDRLADAAVADFRSGRAHEL
jgi:hypothetical protein